MPFCKNCGRPLAENEVCNCATNQNNFNPNVNQTPPPPPQPQNYYNNPGQPVNVQVVQKKSSAGIIIAIIVVVVLFILLVVGGILAAILVPAMVGYTKKSKTQTQIVNSKSIVTAFNASLQEMDEERYAIGGTYIISSDSSRNYVIEDDPSDGKYFDLALLMDKAELYYSDIDQSEWFVVIKNGVASYVGSSEDWHSSYIGTYPPGDYRNGPVFYGDNLKRDNSADLQDLYDWAIARLR